MTLTLEGNGIGKEGAQYLGEALKINKVRKYRSPSDIYVYRHSRQILTTLHLGSNKIGDDGARYLSDALIIGQVR